MASARLSSRTLRVSHVMSCNTSCGTENKCNLSFSLSLRTFYVTNPTFESVSLFAQSITLSLPKYRKDSLDIGKQRLYCRETIIRNITFKLHEKTASIIIILFISIILK